MRSTKILLLLVIASLSVSCASIRPIHNNLNRLLSEEDLQSDIDFVYQKLQNYHPHLYDFISKEDLDFKFDSLKSSLIQPISANDFYFRLGPVIASIGQGHIQMAPRNKKLNVRNMFVMGEKGSSPLALFDYEVFDKQLYIVRNHSDDPSIQPGTEVLSVNGISPQEIFAKYADCITSDGFNPTWVNSRLGIDFPTFFYYEKDFINRVSCELKYHDTIRTVELTRVAKIASSKPKVTRGERIEKRNQRWAEQTKEELQGYDELTKTYSKSLSFLEPDSSIALLKIVDFSHGEYESYYRQCFSLMDSLQTSSLILDLRNNRGGNILDAEKLCSYLVDSTFTFIDPSDVVSKYSILQEKYFKGNPLLINAILAVAYPWECLRRGVSLLFVSKDPDSGNYHLSFPGTLPEFPHRFHFDGNLYLLINGGTFSASALLASNLKGLKRATLIGEETGGSSHGIVAGKMAMFTLPHSRLTILFGLAYIQPHNNPGTLGHGVHPDIEIHPTLEDRILGKDPELEWVLKKISQRSGAF